MAQNGKTKTGKPMSNQDYMNLLYSSDSESDAVPDLKLPPLKGKKQRRRKSSSSKQQEPVCTAWTIIKVIVAFCGLVSIIVLTGLSYWALQRLNELERQIKRGRVNAEGFQRSFEDVPEVYSLSTL